MQRDLGKRSEKGRRTRNQKRPSAHLTADCTALPAGERKDLDVISGKLEQYPHGVVEVVGCRNVEAISRYD